MTARRPRLPERLRIGAKRYKVWRDDGLVEGFAQENGYDAGGFSDYDHAAIVLQENRPHDSDATTLLHEVLHQCLRASGVWPDDIRPGKQGLTVEEQIVAGMTGPLLGVLRDHPELVRFLTASRDT